MKEMVNVLMYSTWWWWCFQGLCLHVTTQSQYNNPEVPIYVCPVFLFLAGWYFIAACTSLDLSVLLICYIHALL